MLTPIIVASRSTMAAIAMRSAALRHFSPAGRPAAFEPEPAVILRAPLTDQFSFKFGQRRKKSQKLGGRSRSWYRSGPPGRSTTFEKSTSRWCKVSTSVTRCRRFRPDDRASTHQRILWAEGL